MRRTLSVVLYVVAFYNVRAIKFLSAFKSLANNTTGWYYYTIASYRTLLIQEKFPLLKNLLLKLRHLLPFKTTQLFSTPVSGSCNFDYYKPINRNCHETDAFFYSYHCMLLQC